MPRVGISQIARLAGVSLATAERALNGRTGVNANTRDRVLQVARDMNYRPNLAARGLASKNKEICIGVCIPRELHVFFDPMRAGVLDEAHRFEDYGLKLVQSTHATVEDDVSPYVERLFNENVQAILLGPAERSSALWAIAEAEKRGIRVVCLLTDVPDSGRTSAVCIDPVLSGALAGELLAKLLPAGSVAAVLTGSMALADHELKVTEFRRCFESHCPGGKVLDVIEAHEDAILAYQKVEELLADTPGLAGIFVATANCVPACRSLIARKRNGTVKMVTTNLFADMKPYLEDGTISAALYQRPFWLGQHAMRVLLDLLLFGKKIESIYSFDPQIILASNASLYLEPAPRTSRSL